MNLTRRAFLQASSLAGVAVALGYRGAPLAPMAAAEPVAAAAIPTASAFLNDAKGYPTRLIGFSVENYSTLMQTVTLKTKGDTPLMSARLGPGEKMVAPPSFYADPNDLSWTIDDGRPDGEPHYLPLIRETLEDGSEHTYSGRWVQATGGEVVVRADLA